MTLPKEAQNSSKSGILFTKLAEADTSQYFMSYQTNGCKDSKNEILFLFSLEKLLLFTLTLSTILRDITMTFWLLKLPHLLC